MGWFLMGLLIAIIIVYTFGLTAYVGKIKMDVESNTSAIAKIKAEIEKQNTNIANNNAKGNGYEH